MQRFTSFLVALFLATTALWAYDLMWDDMFYDYAYYNYDPYTGQYADTTLIVVSTPYDSPLKNRTSIVIPEEVKCGEQTFRVTEIGGGAFKGYDYLEAVTIPNTIKRIGSSAFSSCGSLTSINLPNSVTEIDENAFHGCKSLTSIVIPDSVKVIGQYTFYDCSGLRSVVFPEGLMSIGSYAFMDCINLTAMTLPENITTMGEGVFDKCTKLSHVMWNVQNCQLESINPNPFGVYFNEAAGTGKSPNPITSFVFGDKVEIIPNTLCKGLTQLTSVTIPTSVTTIGTQVFNGCTSLQYVNIPSSVTTIGSGSEYDRFFEGVMNGKVCKVDANLIFDDVHLFVNCKFDSMIIGTSVATLNAEAFVYESRDREPYYGSDIYFESATPPAILNKDAGLGDIVYVHVPTGAKAAYREAFGDNYVFLEPDESRTITGTCGEHLTYTLEPTTGDLTISGYGDMYDYDEAGYKKTTSPFYIYRNLIKNIIFQEGITSIGEYAFCQCPYPQNHITLPQSLQQIKQYALCFSPNGEKKEFWSENGESYYNYDNSINVTEIQIGSNVSYIGYKAFSEAVTTISCAATTPPALQNNSSYNPPAEYLLLIRCPRGTSTAYRAAWGDRGIRRGKYIYAEEGMADTTGILVNDVKWTLNFYTRTLSITGKGEMPNFGDKTIAPWKKYSFLIDSVYIGDSITYIGNNAFRNFARLQSLTIPKGVVAVGYTIAEGSNLQTVYINASLQDANASIASGVISSPIGDWIVGDGHAYFTFDDTKLANVHFADDVTSIAPYMFTMCDSLRSIIIPNSVKIIGRNAFEACHNLASIQLPSSLEVIDTACFFKTTALQTIVIPTTIKRIASEAFVYSAITNINLPEGLEVIEDAAFGSSALTSIKLPNSLRELGTQAFASVKIDTLVIPENVTKIGCYITGTNDMYGNKLHPLKLLVWNAKNAINTRVDVDDIYSSRTIFETDKVIIGNNVESVPNALVEYKYPSLTISDKVQKIGHCAFTYTKGLSDTVYVGTGLTWCGHSALRRYSKNTPRYVFIKDIGAFCNIDMSEDFGSLSAGEALSQLYINGQNVNDIGEIVIPDNVFTIYSYAFYNYDLSNVDIIFGKNVQNAQRNSFAWSPIRSLTTNDNLYMLGGYVYDSGSGEFVVESCFGDHSQIDASHIGTLILGTDIQGLSLYGPVIDNIVWNVRYYESCYLKYPSTLQSIEFGDSVLNVPAHLCRNTNLLSVHLPDNVSSIGEQAFYGCSSLSDLSLSSSLLSVGKEAFSGCNRLSSLTFRERCQLDSKAFYNCTGLQHIYCHSEIPGNCASDAFDGLDKFACTLHVPAGSQPKYQVATGWRDFYYTEEIGTKEIAVSVTASNDRYGTVTLSGTGTYHDGDQLTLTATANTGYTFLLWSDGVFANPRTLTLTHDTTLVAYFDPLSNETRYIATTCDPAQGEVTGGGEYYLHTEATLTAVPAAGYQFVRWSDGTTDNPYTFVVTDDVTLTAEFAQTTGVQDVATDSATSTDLTPYKVFRDGQVYILRGGKTYTLTGEEVK